MSTPDSTTQASLPSPTQRLLGKVAIVTGGASGIGESIVRLFHNHGAKVCLVDIQDTLGQSVCEKLSDETKICYFHCDVAIENDISRAIDFTVSKYGKLDIMINNAGLTGSPNNNIHNADLLEFEKVFNINVKGVFLGMKYAAKVMIPHKKGTIISICSISSVMGELAPMPIQHRSMLYWALPRILQQSLEFMGFA